MALSFSASTIIQISGKSTHKKSVNFVLSAFEVVGNPIVMMKSKAHAVRHEHSLIESITIFALFEISYVSKARTIAECYLINMFEKFCF